MGNGTDDGPEQGGGGRLVATFDLYHPEFPLTPTLAALPNVEVRPELQPLVFVDVAPRTIFVSVSGAGRSDVEAALAADPTVTTAQRVDTVDGRDVYRIVAATKPRLPSPLADRGVRVLDATSSAGGWRLRVSFIDRGGVRAFVRIAREAGFEVTLVRLHPLAGGAGQSFGLTPDEYETLVHAYRRGYFESPRALTQSELAAELGISGSVLSRRLRHAFASLVQHTLTPDGPEPDSERDR